MTNKVIVIEDDVILNQVFCRYLKHSGYVTESAYSVAMALNYLQDANPPAAVILDMQLADGMCTQVLELLVLPQFDRTYVVVVSGNVPPVQTKMRLSRVDQFLLKPVSPRGLSSLLQISKRQPTQPLN